MKKITRRQALGIAAGAATALGVTAVVVQASGTSSPATSPAAGSSAGPGAGSSAPALSLPKGGIDEVYQGRRIQITLADAGEHHDGHHTPGMPTVKVDGKELHLMRNADNSWTSVVNHYETFPDPISAARAAVRELQGAGLVPFEPTEGKS